MIEIIESCHFASWYDKLDGNTQGAIQKRLERIRQGNFGDHKSVGEGVWELRFCFGGGIRIYYTYDGVRLVLLLAGGNKSTQSKDIAFARRMAKDIGGR